MDLDRGLSMGEQTPTEYQREEHLAQCQDIMRAAFSEGSGRNDQRGAQADMH